MDETHALIEQRRQKLAALRARGIDPFANKFTPSEGCGEARQRYAEGREVAVAGRVVAHRDMGKSQFLVLQDQSGRLQAYVQQQAVGAESFDVIKHLDLGDFMGARGPLFTTRTGEVTVKVQSFTLLAKALRPPPAKWHGLEDVEIRYRQRYLDLMADERVRDLFFKRSQIVWEIRRFLHERGYIEVETPMMQSIPGGAAAQPFVTWHNALGVQFHLRIAIELYLKRLLVGGMDRVFEIGRNFRNEGLSRRHNPEFTMLEVYQAYGDCAGMMDLVEGLITTVAQNVLGTLAVRSGDGVEISLARPWRRATYAELVQERMGTEWPGLPLPEKRARARAAGLDIPDALPELEITHEVYEKLIERTLQAPTFVTRLPAALVPLAKRCPDDESVVDVFELEIGGQEIAPGYSELNDPLEQRRRFQEQARRTAGTAEEQSGRIDEDFLVALEHGMPPAGGMGLGIDRLVMLLTGAASIRDVILFPQMRAAQPKVP